MKLPLIRSVLIAAFIVVGLLAVTHRSSFTADLRSSFRPPKFVHHASHAGHVDSISEAQNTLQHSSQNRLDCRPDLKHLQKVVEDARLSSRFQYVKRHIKFTRTTGLERKSMTKLQQKLIPDKYAFHTVEVDKAIAATSSCHAPIELPVPESGLPKNANASDFMFGVSTTYKRFMHKDTSPINEWVFWLTDGRGRSNGGKLVLLLLDASSDQLQEVANLLGDSGINADVYSSDSKQEMAVRYVTLVPTLYMHPEAHNKKWLVTCDDDTFFPYMHGLVEKINSYDHTKEMYIGALSEDVGAINRHGSQAFGGAGVFLSLPLAKRITELFPDCTSESQVKSADSGWGPQGDILLRKCIYENTETRLTNLWDLWQLDILGRPDGFYEWGIKPLSLHHYRGGGWHHAKPGDMAKIATSCGEDCTLLRFQTEDDFIVSGYSVAHYPNGITFDTQQAERTFHPPPDDYGWNFDFKFGPLRPTLMFTGRKISWELHSSEVHSDGTVVQTFIRHRDDDRWTRNGKPMSNIDGIIDLVWIPS